MDEKRFAEAKNKIVGEKRIRQGIGTMREKTVHAVLKNYYAPDQDMHEIPIDQYVADIYTGSSIIEIQTAQFNRLREKLACFLPQYPVMVGYPIAYRRTLVWVDEATGECIPAKRASRKGSVYDAFSELYKIKSYLKNENLTLCFPMLELEEYKLLNGWGKEKKNHASKYDRIPIAICNEIRFERSEDYLQLIPYDMPEPFSVQDFGKAVKIPRSQAAIVLNILFYLEQLDRVGKQGNAYLYQVCENR